LFINLRKSAALQQEILAAVPPIKTSVNVSVYDALPASVIAQAALDTVKAMELRSSLLDALYEIRDAVAVANVTSGITQLVARRARIEKDIAVLAAVASAEVRPSDATILAKVQRQATADVNHYSFSESISFAILPQPSIDSVKDTIAALKREKVSIQDKLLELNIKNTIKLSEVTVAILSEQGLI
jgi:hypothetical protein